jgi:peptidoglycan/xylan/chitin deacetylase (PgdA/CDA1 family)
MSVRTQVGNARRRIVRSLWRRSVPLGTHGPIVTFCFDDFPRSALTVGAPILESFGVHATYYVAMSLVNSQNNLGEQFRQEDLGLLVDRGHELASHTFSHFSARNVSCDTFRDDVIRGESAIRESLGVSASGNFAYPYGDVTLGSKKRLGPKARSCRGTFPGLNGPDVDLNLLCANSLYGDVDRVEAAKRLIVKNEEENRWLIFYTHDVASKPSPFGCTPRLLEATCSFAAVHHARFMTVAQVMEELGQGRNTAIEGKSSLDCRVEAMENGRPSIIANS